MHLAADFNLPGVPTTRVLSPLSPGGSEEPDPVSGSIPSSQYLPFFQAHLVGSLCLPLSSLTSQHCLEKKMVCISIIL